MSEFINQFHFLRPAFLFALVPAILVTWALLRQQNQARQWQAFIAPHLLHYLVDGQTTQVKRLPLLALLGLWLLATLALAGPAWKKLPQPVHKEGSALVVVWDLSPSMKATDLNPSRVVRARLKLFDLLKTRKEGVTALISYSGEAHIVTPLTDDSATISSLLNGLHPDIMPVAGSNAEMALEMALRLLDDGGIQRGDILFVTDGIASQAHNTLADLAKTRAHRIVVWGIGTAEGAPIPGKNSGFLKNSQGDIIISQLDEQQLSDASAAMGGIYLPFTNNDFDLKSFQSLTGPSLSQKHQETQRTFDQWYEHGPHLLLLMLPLAAFAFRRGWLLSLLCLGVLLPSDRTYALGWDNLWLNKDQQAHKELQSGDPAAAAEKFKNQQWKGVANYKTQNYQTALQNFSQQESAETLFNQGNALTHLEDYPQAKAAYERALELNPELQQAKDNLEIVKQLEQLQQQNQQQNQDNNQNNQDPNQDNNSQQNDQQNSQQNADSDAAKNQQQSDQQQSGDPSDQASNGQQQEQQENQQADSEPGQDASQQGDKQLSEQQRQALEQQYGEAEQEQEQQQAQQHAQQQGDTENPQQTPQQAQQQAADAQQNEDQQNQSLASALATQQRSEEDQALEQWLRKVPDDPSGLLRNKFKYESRERQLKLREGATRRPPGNREPRL